MNANFYERIPVTIYQNADEASKKVAGRIADLIRSKNAGNEDAVLGLATGSTPIRVYDQLIRLHEQEGLSFERVITFNLDEYYPIAPSAKQSYVRFMNENLFNHIDIPKENVHVPDGQLDKDDVDDYCRHYEEMITE